MKVKNYFVDLGALVLAFFLAVFVKLEIQSLLLQIEEYSSGFDSLNMSSDSYIALVQMEQYVEGVSSLVSLAYMLIVVVLPLGLYLLFCLSQGFNYRKYFEKKVSWFYLLKFFVLGVPFYLTVVYVFSKLFDLVFINFGSFFDFFLIGFYLCLLVVVGFVWLGLAALLAKDKLKWSHRLRKVFRWNKFLWFVLLFVVGLVVLVLSFIMFVNVITWSFYDWFVWFGLIVLGLLWVFGFLRDKFLGKFK